MSTCLCCFAHAQTNSPRSRGTLRNVARANNQWAWEYRYQDPVTNKRKSLFLGLDKFPTQTAAERHLEAFVLKLNAENPTLAVMEPTFDAILDRFVIGRKAVPHTRESLV